MPMRPNPLNPKEWIYGYILGYITDNGYSPINDEILEAWNISHEDKATHGFVVYYVGCLVKEGKLAKKSRGGWRSLRLITDGTPYDKNQNARKTPKPSPI
jgi:hypothetical protein